jgi:ankyrin repeat protein
MIASSSRQQLVSYYASRKPLVINLLHNLETIESISSSLHQHTTPQQASVLDIVVEQLTVISPTKEETCSTQDIKRELERISTVAGRLLYICKIQDSTVAVKLLASELENQHNQQLELDRIRLKDRDCCLTHLCAQRNDVQSLELLVQYGASLDTVDTLHATPLFYAVANNCSDAAAFLLFRGANPNAKDAYFKSPLHVALRNQFISLAEILVLFKADVDLTGIRGNSSLFYFAEKGHLGNVKFLIEQLKASTSRLNHDGENLLTVSLAHPTIVQYLIERYRDNGQLSAMVKSKNNRGENIIHLCCKLGYYSSLLLILSALQQDVTSDSSNKILNVPDCQGNSPLMLAVLFQNTTIVTFLCACEEVAIDAFDMSGDTALHHAIQLKLEQETKILLGVGCASVTIRNRNKQCAESLAKQSNFEYNSIKEHKKHLETKKRERSKELKEFAKDRKRMRKFSIDDEAIPKTRSLTNLLEISKKKLSQLIITPRRDSAQPINV